MCSECAKVLRFQTNRCPICRTPVEKLLEIKVPKRDSELGGAAESSSSQTGAEPAKDPTDDGVEVEWIDTKSALVQASDGASKS